MSARRRDRAAGAALALAPLAMLALAVGVVAAVFSDGAGQVGVDFLTQAPREAGREGGIGPMLVATGWVLAVGIGAALPLGTATAIYLAEFTRGGRALRVALDVLAAVPSIVYGLFGLAFFCEALGLGWSVLAGGLTVAVMVLPLFVRLGEAALRAVPSELRSAGAALGLPRWRLLIRVLLPQATPALAAALVLATGRMMAESAVLLFTAGASTRTPVGLLDPGRVLAVHVYLLAVEVPGGGPRAAGTAAVLLGAVAFTTASAALLPRLLLRRGAAA